MRTVYLRKSATGPLRVRRGALAAAISPGEYVDVPDEIAATLVAAGASYRSRPTEGDEPTPPEE